VNKRGFCFWQGLFVLFLTMLIVLNFPKKGTHATSILNGQLRKFPYPYQAMLSLTSDIDGTTPEEFALYHRFLNTKEDTPMGKGLGLDVDDSFWMYMATDSSHPYYVDNKRHRVNAVITYFQGINPNQDKDAKLIAYYFRAGWIDSMHGYGDFSRLNTDEALCTRPLAKAAWKRLNADGIHPEIWINHGNKANRQNFGAYTPRGFASYQAGDDRTSSYYHTDLAIKNGVHFLWNSNCEAEFGQDSAIYPITLRDGNRMWGFHRYTYDRLKRGVNWTWGPKALDIQLTRVKLDSLVKRKQYAVIAQHFGGGNEPVPFDAKNAQALRLLASYQSSGKILITRTSRLLNYNIAQKYIHYSVSNENGRIKIILLSIDDPLFGKQPVALDKIRGLTFYVNDPHQTDIFVGGRLLHSPDVQYNPPDQTGKRSISIAWFAPDTFDYSKQAPPIQKTF
jgi:hypothetical protein